MSEVFARVGVVDILVTDNALNFTSAEFAVFAKTWTFENVTSSPHYPESNGTSGNAVKTVKRLFQKCRDSGENEFNALLDWLNTPTAGVDTSPAQLLMERRCKNASPSGRNTAATTTLYGERTTWIAGDEATTAILRQPTYEAPYTDRVR